MVGYVIKFFENRLPNSLHLKLKKFDSKCKIMSSFYIILTTPTHDQKCFIVLCLLEVFIGFFCLV